MRPRYMFTAYFLFKGAVMAVLNFFEPSSAAVWCSLGSLFIGAPLMAALEYQL